MIAVTYLPQNIEYHYREFRRKALPTEKCLHLRFQFPRLLLLSYYHAYQYAGQGRPSLDANAAAKMPR